MKNKTKNVLGFVLYNFLIFRWIWQNSFSYWSTDKMDNHRFVLLHCIACLCVIVFIHVWSERSNIDIIKYKKRRFFFLFLGEALLLLDKYVIIIDINLCCIFLIFFNVFVCLTNLYKTDFKRNFSEF
jgi:hypothetical protein